MTKTLRNTLMTENKKEIQNVHKKTYRMYIERDEFR